MNRLLTILIFVAGCTTQSETTQSSGTSSTLRLATTTSTRDSGLLSQLLPEFENAQNCRVDVVAVGTGAALKLGEAGDADVILVHAREAEKEFMQAEHGVRHEEFMENTFLILGPASDPAGIRKRTPSDALRRIAAGKYHFVSRGDDSGTHKREQQLWADAGGLSRWKNYLESGQGMGPALMMADELRAYLLIDQGTYLNFRKKIELTPLVSNAPQLKNPYAVIVVNPQKNLQVNSELAESFVEFLLAQETQRTIADYRVNGQPLFHPTRLSDK